MKGEFQEIAREARSAHTVVKELVDEAKDEKSVLNQRGAARQQELLDLISGLQKALEELDHIVHKYSALSRRERRIWDQLKMATKDLSGIREKLIYHLTAINAFTDSLERGTLARMETVLLELVEEVRQGRRPPTIVSIDNLQDTSGWKELGSELAEDGITEADVAEHKAAIRVFLLGRLKDSTTDDLSFHDVASAIESADGHSFLDSTVSNLSATSETQSIVSAAFDSGVERQDTVGSQQTFQTARENLEQEAGLRPAARALQVTFAPFTRIPQEPPSNTSVPGSAKRFGKLTLGKSSLRSVYQYRRSVDYGPNQSLLGPKSQIILIIDPIHSCKPFPNVDISAAELPLAFSKIMHAYLRSLTINQPLVRERINAVHSTGWKMQESGGIDRIPIDDMIKDLLLKKGIEVPSLDTYYKFAEFHLGDVLQFDHIIYLESPSFLQYLEDNVHRIAHLKTANGLEDQQPAKLTRYDLSNSRGRILLPEYMSEKRGLGPEIFRSRQKLALEEVFGAVQRLTNDFLERELGITKSSQGFKKVVDRRPSSASVASTIDAEGVRSIKSP
ncbi:MAG: hypothetical protein L6R39_003411 [Caloplaca ligustica]|nr:MAG: hypothetical protein L6R39_003411 [Caloplaca ligustica]